jgi:hypothetical protein
MMSATGARKKSSIGCSRKSSGYAVNVFKNFSNEKLFEGLDENSTPKALGESQGELLSSKEKKSLKKFTLIQK